VFSGLNWITENYCLRLIVLCRAGTVCGAGVAAERGGWEAAGGRSESGHAA
jgi:hypothetical protein